MQSVGCSMDPTRLASIRAGPRLHHMRWIIVTNFTIICHRIVNTLAFPGPETYLVNADTKARDDAPDD